MDIALGLLGLLIICGLVFGVHLVSVEEKRAAANEALHDECEQEQVMFGIGPLKAQLLKQNTKGVNLMSKIEMDAVEYLEEVQRMSAVDADSYLEFAMLGNRGSEASAAKVAYVAEWRAKHPKASVKTRMQDFFEKHPLAPHTRDGIPEACCKRLGYTTSCPIDGKITNMPIANYCETASKMCRSCWRKSVED